jgi:hypothetical protein
MKNLISATFHLPVFAMGLALLAGACCEEGSGVVVEETRPVGAFRQLTLDVSGTVTLTQGPSSPLKLRTDDNLIDNVVTTVRDDGDTLVIEADDSSCCIDPTELEVQVSSDDIDALLIRGSGEIAVRGPLEAGDLSLAVEGSGSIAADAIAADDVSLDIDGSGDMDLRIDAAVLDSSIEGSGSYRLAGSAGEHSIEIDGSGDVDASALATGTTRVDIQGSGDCSVAASDVLDVSVEGSGDVSYCGDPRVTESIDGSGSVERVSTRCE